MTATLTHPADITPLDTLTTDTLPLPLGEGRGEGHPLSPSSPPRATDSDAASAEKSVRYRPVADPLPLPLGEGAGERLDISCRARHQPPSFHPKPQSPTPKPDPLPRDLLNRLLTLYTTHSNSFNDLCRELDLPTLELLDLLDHPDVTRAIERLAQASESRAKTLARLTNDSAVSALIDLIDTTDKPETRRKAAGAILRHGKPPSKAAKREIRDELPLPLGEGRGEGHQSRASSPPRAADSDTTAQEKSVPPLRRGAPSGCCQTPTERSSGAGLISDIPGRPRAGGANEKPSDSAIPRAKSQAA